MTNISDLLSDEKKDQQDCQIQGQKAEGKAGVP
jgi:hypothetical protein